MTPMFRTARGAGRRLAALVALALAGGPLLTDAVSFTVQTTTPMTDAVKAELAP